MTINDGNQHMNKARIYCTDQLDGGTSFGVREDTGESVFIPASIANRVSMGIGTSHMASLIVNARCPEKTPWFAVFAAVSTDDQAPEVDEVLAGIERLLLRSDSYLTTKEVADEFGISEVDARRTLEHLFAAGSAARAEVLSQKGAAPALYLWAKSVAVFTMMEE